MKNLKLAITGTAFAMALSGASLAIAGEGLSGASVLTFNTFTGADTGGMEMDVGIFGMVNNTFATVGDGVELPGFIDLYDIDFADNSISFNWVETGFSTTVSGPTPEENQDRNYFVFDLPAGMAIKSVEFDAANSTLLEGSALPTIEIVSHNKIVTNFAAGVIRAAGFAPSFTVTVGAAE